MVETVNEVDGTAIDLPEVEEVYDPSTPEYEAQMAAKGEAAVTGYTKDTVEEAPPEAVSPKPDYVEDKFYNAETGEVNYEAMAKSYAELQTKQSKESPTKENKGEATEQTEEAAQAVEKAGLDMNNLQQEYADTGVISDDSLEALAKSGIPKETVDAYVAGQEALVAQVRTQAFEITGGQDNYESMMGWADTNLTTDEKADFNNVVNQVKSTSRNTFISGLYARYTADVGTTGKLVQGKSASSTTTTGFTSKAAMMTAMSDPRYASDTSYRDKVIAKLSQSEGM